MRKIIVVIVLAFGLVGCGEAKNDTAPSPTPRQSAQMSPQDAVNLWQAAQPDEFANACSVISEAMASGLPLDSMREGFAEGYGNTPGNAPADDVFNALVIECAN